MITREFFDNMSNNAIFNYIRRLEKNKGIKEPEMNSLRFLVEMAAIKYFQADINNLKFELIGWRAKYIELEQVCQQLRGQLNELKSTGPIVGPIEKEEA